MSYLARYIAYLKNNPEGYWFRRKLIGWGWTPARWQGWLVLAIYFALFIPVVISFTGNTAPTDTEVRWFLAKIVVLSSVLIGVCYLTGERPKWQWGIPDSKSNT